MQTIAWGRYIALATAAEVETGARKVGSIAGVHIEAPVKSVTFAAVPTEGE